MLDRLKRIFTRRPAIERSAEGYSTRVGGHTYSAPSLAALRSDLLTAAARLSQQPLDYASFSSSEDSARWAGADLMVRDRARLQTIEGDNLRRAALEIERQLST